MIDGKPLPVGGASHDPDARNGHGAGKIAKGYKLHAIWGRAAVPEAWSVEPLNVCETKAAEALTGFGTRPGWLSVGRRRIRRHGGLRRRRCGRLPAGGRGEDPNAGLGHRKQSRYRLRSIELQKSEFGEALSRPAVDRASIRQCHLLRGRAGPAAGLGPKDVAGLALDMGEVDDQRGAVPRETRTYVAYAIS